jgi:Ca2+-binding RTX toxin-like protein
MLVANALLMIKGLVYGQDARTLPPLHPADVPTTDQQEHKSGTSSNLAQAAEDEASAASERKSSSGKAAVEDAPTAKKAQGIIAALVREDSLFLVKGGQRHIDGASANAPDVDGLAESGGASQERGADIIDFPRRTAGPVSSVRDGADPGQEAGPGIGDPIDNDNEDDDNPTDDEGPRPVNRAPVVLASVSLGSTFMNQSVLIGMNDLLQHSSDPDGDDLAVVDLTASSGTLVRRSATEWLFTPVQGDTGEVDFSYAVDDGLATVEQSARLDLIALGGERIVGSDDADTILGTPRDDVMDARAGADIVLGREGDDVIEGGEGNDRLIGGDGNDVIHGGPGHDIIFGGDGNDVLFGDAGDDFIDAGDGDDVVIGGEGNDIVLAGKGRDIVEGGPGDDNLEGGDDNDLLSGGADNDTIIGGSGDDRQDGGAGNDRFVATAGDGDDVIDGGEGTDTYDLSLTTEDSIIDLDAGLASSTSTGSDVLISIENAVGGGGADRLVAGVGTNILTGGPGEDAFVFRTSASAGGGKGSRDLITDLEVGDRIDLDEISREFADQFEDTFEDQGIKKFMLIKESDVFKRPGELRIKYEDLGGGSEVTIIEGNIDFDADTDFEIELAGNRKVEAYRLWDHDQ